MTEYRPLEIFLSRLKADSSVCSLDLKQGTRSPRQWSQRFYQWRQLLATQKSTRWAVYEEDCFEFSAILFALWSLDRKVYLPGNNQPGHIKALGPYVEAFAGAFPSEHTIAAPADDASVQHIEIDNSSLLLSMNEELLYVFTSGSTGEPQAIGKTLAQISAELDTLHQQWGQTLKKVHILSSVSHQHIYGLLFRCLWPLLEGWSFDAHARQYTETFNAPDNTLALLVSSPTHLSRLSLENSNSPLERVFSSGAPLDFHSSQRAKQYFQCPITEVLGSSETGGIAWRQQQTQSHSPWTTFACVDIDIAENQQLMIRSPYLPDARQWFKSNDGASRINETQFVLTGRIDRIIKLEGKRLSLDEMESRLKQHSLILDAHLVTLDHNNNRLGAIISLAEPPSDSSTSEKRSLTNTFKAHLLSHFERPTLPKKWRYVAQLPRNSQGKLNLQDTKSLFSKTQEKPTLPIVVSSQESEKGYTLSLRIPEDLLYFDGHFDQSPILPGIVQLQWAEKYARELFKLDAHFIRLEALKFQKIATPGLTLTLDLSWSKTNAKIQFKYTSAIGQHASGRIVLAS